MVIPEIGLLDLNPPQQWKSCCVHCASSIFSFHIISQNVEKRVILNFDSFLFQYHFKRRCRRFLTPLSSLSQSISPPAAFGFPLQGFGGGEAVHS